MQTSSHKVMLVDRLFEARLSKVGIRSLVGSCSSKLRFT